MGQGVSLDVHRKVGEEQQGAQGGVSGKLWPVQPLQLVVDMNLFTKLVPLICKSYIVDDGIVIQYQYSSEN